jgi:hypothetical protein
MKLGPPWLHLDNTMDINAIQMVKERPKGTSARTKRTSVSVLLVIAWILLDGASNAPS